MEEALSVELTEASLTGAGAEGDKEEIAGLVPRSVAATVGSVAAAAAAAAAMVKTTRCRPRGRSQTSAVSCTRPGKVERGGPTQHCYGKGSFVPCLFVRVWGGCVLRGTWTGKEVDGRLNNAFPSTSSK